MKFVLSSLVVGSLMLFDLAAAKDTPDTPQMAPMALNSYTATPRNITAVNVFNQNGDLVGRVQRLDLDPSGKPQKVEVYLTSSGRLIDVPAYNASYDEQQNLVTVGLDRSQLSQAEKVPRN